MRPAFGVSALHFSDSAQTRDFLNRLTVLAQTELFVKTNTCLFLLFCILPFMDTNNINNHIRLRTYHCSSTADPRTPSNHAFVAIYNFTVDESNHANCQPFYFCGMVQNLTEVIQDRKQNKLPYPTLPYHTIPHPYPPTLPYPSPAPLSNPTLHLPLPYPTL